VAVPARPAAGFPPHTANPAHRPAPPIRRQGISRWCRASGRGGRRWTGRLCGSREPAVGLLQLRCLETFPRTGNWVATLDLISCWSCSSVVSEIQECSYQSIVAVGLV
uniref:Uncharacterized protein n=1 Tax=Leersia perrieri TaxID=77586 RepID=A0A0D9XC59_9ORYZ